MADSIVRSSNHRTLELDLRLPRIASLLDEAPEILSCLQDSAILAKSALEKASLTHLALLQLMAIIARINVSLTTTSF